MSEQDIQNTQTQQNIQPEKKGMNTWVKVALGCGGCLLISVIGFSILAALGVAGLKKGVEEIDKQIKEEERKQTDAKAEAFNSPKLKGQKVTVGTVDWTLIQTEEVGQTIKADDEFGEDCKATEGTKFVKIRYSIKNNGNSGISAYNLPLLDGDKREFKSYDSLIRCIGTDKDGKVLLIETLNPSVERTFINYYEVPETVKSLCLQVEDYDLLNPVTDYISLGIN